MRLAIAAQAACALWLAASSVAQAQDARPFRDGKYGVRNAGQVTISPRFDNATLSRTGLIITQSAGKIGFVNRLGREVIPPRYDSVTIPKFGLYVVRVGGRFCLVDSNARQILPCVYNSLSIMSSSQLRATQNGRSFVIDRNGRELQTASAPARPAAAPVRPAAAPPRPANGTRPASAASGAQISGRVRALADARQWDNAIRAALSGSARDKLYVLLVFRNSSINDMQRWPGQRVVLANMRIFDDAMKVADPAQQRALQEMRRSFNDYLRNHGAPSAPVAGSGSFSRPSSTFSPSRHQPYQPSQTRQLQDFRRNLDQAIRRAVR